MTNKRLFEFGTFVKMTRRDSRTFFGVLQRDVIESDNTLACKSGNKHVNYYSVDPLTGEVYDGMWAVEPTNLKAIQPLDPSIPLADFVILDFGLLRFGFRNAGKGDDDTKIDSLYQQLCRRMGELGKNVLSASINPIVGICSTDFTELGLDFMRQHFRTIQREAIANLKPPSLESLLEKVELTAGHRTKANDYLIDMNEV